MEAGDPDSRAWRFVEIHLGLVYVYSALQNDFEGLFGNSSSGEEALGNCHLYNLSFGERKPPWESLEEPAEGTDRAAHKSRALEITGVPAAPPAPRFSVLPVGKWCALLKVLLNVQVC